MNHWLRHRTTALLGFALAALLLCAPSAQAQIACSGTPGTSVTLSSSINFGSVNPLSTQSPLATASGTLNYTCKNTSNNSTYSATVCFNLGEPAAGQTNPRLMSNGSNTLQFQLYQNSGYSTVWGSSGFGTFLTPLVVSIRSLAPGQTYTNSATMYGQVLGGQTAVVPGTYIDTYGSGDFSVVVNNAAGSTAPGTCTTGTTTNPVSGFTVNATVAKQCTVTAGTASNINLGSVPSTQTNISGNNSISVSCSNTTPYYIGLSPNSTGSLTGAGTMSGTISGNTDKVPYQLYSNAALSTVWGNTATSTSVGNGVSGSGTGSTKSIPVYAKAPSANYTPDSYSDTVTVNVNY